MGISVKITKNKIPQFTAELMNKIGAGLELAGMGVERTWKQTARVDTGRYKSSIGHWSNDIVKPNEFAKPEDALWQLQSTGAFVQLYIGTNVEYALSLESRFPSQGGVNAVKTNEGLVLDALKLTMGEAFRIL